MSRRSPQRRRLRRYRRTVLNVLLITLLLPFLIVWWGCRWVIEGVDL